MHGAEPLCRRAAGQIRFDLRLRHHRALWRRQVPARVRARGERGRVEGRLDHLEPQGPVSRRRRGAGVLPDGVRARRAGGDPSAVGGLRRGAAQHLSPRLERGAADGSGARAVAAHRQGHLRALPEAEARRLASRRRHLRDDRAHGLRLQPRRRGVLPRQLRADAHQEEAERVFEDDVSRIDLLSRAGGALRGRDGGR